MPLPWIIPLAIGAAQAISGGVNKAKANKEAKDLRDSRPKYLENPLVQQELDLAESEAASGGLSANSMNVYNNLDNSQFAGSLEAILRSGGGANNVGDLYGNNQQGRARLALINDQLRMAKLDRLSRARERKIEEADKGFLYNEDSPWKDNAQANALARQQATNDIWSGVQTAGGGISEGLAMMDQKKAFDNYWGTGKSAYKEKYGRNWRQVYRTETGRNQQSNYDSWLQDLEPNDDMGYWQVTPHPNSYQNQARPFQLEGRSINPYNWNY